MRAFWLWCGLALLASAGLAQPTSIDLARERAAAWAERFLAQITADPPNPGSASRDAFLAASALAATGAFDERQTQLLAFGAAMQDTGEASPTRGNYRWRYDATAVFDHNAVDFCLQNAWPLWHHHRAQLPAAAREILETTIPLAVEGALARRVRPDYTNIALMNAGNLILYGESLGLPAVADEGYRRLDAVGHAIWDHGIAEYNSPTYYGVDLDNLSLIEAYAAREDGLATTRALFELFAAQVGANWFVPNQVLSGPASRDYDYLRGTGIVSYPLWLWGWRPDPRGNNAGALLASYGRWRPADAWAPRVPAEGRLVRSRFGAAPAQTWTNYVLPDLAIGSASAPYHTMDINLAVHVAAGEQALRAYFIPDARHDPYGQARIAEGNNGHQKTLHLTPYWTAAQAGRDVLALIVHRAQGVPPEGVALNSDFVLPNGADEVHIGTAPVAAPDQPWIQEVPAGSAIFWRRGNALIGVRVLAALQADGTPARVEIAHDGNRFGALRLHIQHSSAPANVGRSAAVLWVRAVQLAGPAAAPAARAEFAAALGAARLDEGDFAASAVGLDGPLAIAANADFSRVSLHPLPPADPLELDGEPIGRRILAQAPLFAGLRDEILNARVFTVAPAAPTEIEAEAGVLRPAFVRADDPLASGGTYVWSPGEVDRDGGAGGQASYHLDVARAGTYRLEGRVLLPTPKDDSFWVTLADAQGQATAAPALWSPEALAEWTWREFGPLDLPAGRSQLIIAEREDGSKLDCLRLVPLLETP